MREPGAHSCKLRGGAGAPTRAGPGLVSGVLVTLGVLEWRAQQGAHTKRSGRTEILRPLMPLLRMPITAASMSSWLEKPTTP